MLTVISAKFRRLVERGDETLGEVEVHTDRPEEPDLLAYFRQGPGGYQLAQVLEGDASTEIDWYDNNLHDAYEDVTMVMFGGPSRAAAGDRRSFAERVLAMDGVREELDKHFRQAAQSHNAGR